CGSQGRAHPDVLVGRAIDGIARAPLEVGMSLASVLLPVLEIAIDDGQVEAVIGSFCTAEARFLLTLGGAAIAVAGVAVVAAFRAELDTVTAFGGARRRRNASRLEATIDAAAVAGVVVGLIAAFAGVEFSVAALCRI